MDLDQYGYDVIVLTETWDTVKGKEDQTVCWWATCRTNTTRRAR